ncbi:hypothetical protein C8J56DRAFT_1050349 [Mycena floridula]|nr:hypothetical protein C8J56DRAFT_1050349 [Mycena floridula]
MKVIGTMPASLDVREEFVSGEGGTAWQNFSKGLGQRETKRQMFLLPDPTEDHDQQSWTSTSERAIPWAAPYEPKHRSFLVAGLQPSISQTKRLEQENIGRRSLKSSRSGQGSKAQGQDDSYQWNLSTEDTEKTAWKAEEGRSTGSTSLVRLL